MAITNINGVPWTNVVSVGGVVKASITSISGVSTPPPVSCTTVYYGYSDGRRQPPTDACLVIPQPYNYDSTNNLLYVNGGCGTTFAPPGFYSDGMLVYDWDGFFSFTIFGACPR